METRNIFNIGGSLAVVIPAETVLKLIDGLELQKKMLIR